MGPQTTTTKPSVIFSQLLLNKTRPNSVCNPTQMDEVQKILNGRRPKNSKWNNLIQLKTIQFKGCGTSLSILTCIYIVYLHTLLGHPVASNKFCTKLIFVPCTYCTHCTHYAVLLSQCKTVLA